MKFEYFNKTHYAFNAFSPGDFKSLINACTTSRYFCFQLKVFNVKQDLRYAKRCIMMQKPAGYKAY